MYTLDKYIKRFNNLLTIYDDSTYEFVRSKYEFTRCDYCKYYYSSNDLKSKNIKNVFLEFEFNDDLTDEETDLLLETSIYINILID
jgi:hypothetical protein